jgi:hypothetical protein
MDLALFTSVLWRSRWLVLAGLACACVFAVLAMARVEIVGGVPHLVYRDPLLYQSSVRMLVTQRGFPEGRTVFNTSPTMLPSGSTQTPTFADPSRFTELAVLYSQLIMGDDQRIRAFGGAKQPLYEDIVASPMPAPGGGGGFLPIIEITGIAPSPTKAMALADRAATTFSGYLAQRQARTQVAESDRVILDRIAEPLPPAVYLPRKRAPAILVFALLLMLTVAAVFIRENVRGRRLAVVEAEAPPLGPSLSGRSGLSDSGRSDAALARDP